MGTMPKWWRRGTKATGKGIGSTIRNTAVGGGRWWRRRWRRRWRGGIWGRGGDRGVEAREEGLDVGPPRWIRLRQFLKPEERAVHWKDQRLSWWNNDLVREETKIWHCRIHHERSHIREEAGERVFPVGSAQRFWQSWVPRSSIVLHELKQHALLQFYIGR